jgi:hypothetical protein
MYQSPGPQPASAPVCAQAEILMARLRQIEGAMAGREWWLLGRALPVAGVLAEVASLLAVARAELEQVVAQVCGRASAAPADPAAEAVDAEDGPDAPGEDLSPDALEQDRIAAGQVLELLRAALPPTLGFARQLAPFAERGRMPPPVVEGLGVVADRLADALEALSPAAG